MLDLLAAPEILVLEFEEPDIIALHWTLIASESEAPVSYEVQQATTPNFETPNVYSVANPTTDIFLDDLCSVRYYFRVRAVQGASVSPWSSTGYLTAPIPEFTDCTDEPLSAPLLQRVEDEVTPTIQWTHESIATAYTIEEAGDPGFLTAVTIAEAIPSEQFFSLNVEGQAYLQFDVGIKPEGLYYYRVRPLNENEEGPWSNTVLYYIAPDRGWIVRDKQEYDAGLEEGLPSRQDLLSIHRAMIRLCAGRGDMLAVLSLPRHFRETETQAHAALLTPDTRDDLEVDIGNPLTRRIGDPAVLSFDEERALTYAAMYHPWVASRIEGRNGAVVHHPPDGDAVGMIAAQTINRGAWIAPANIPLKGVLALDPDFEQRAWEALWMRQINIVRPDPRGFLLLSADTLSQQIDLRSIHVRLLMILLRRMALREGRKYVFESNDAELRRSIYYHFDAVLGTLYRRGAFSGNTTTEAFQVITGETINRPNSIERGRLFIELRVSPAESLNVLTVRLVQQGTEGFEAQEV